MFENIISQKAIETIASDFVNKRLPQSILFAGEANTAKCTTAIELARVLSCEQDTEWTCPCDSCNHMRSLNSVDFLIIGPKDITSEIKASANTFLKIKTKGVHFLFSRAVKKLLMRFDPRLWSSDETRFVKASSIIVDIQTNLDTVLNLLPNAGEEKAFKAIEKAVKKIIELSEKLQNECMYETLPVNQVRKASEWLRLAPTGKYKFLIVENAEAMQESARAAFLKILEEPPKYAIFILTSTRPGAILPTILSRLRKYSFAKRDFESEKKIIERVFHDEVPSDEEQAPLARYFKSFLPVDFETIQVASLEFFTCMFHYYAPKAKNTSSQFRSFIQSKACEVKTISQILTSLEKLKSETVFNLFIKELISLMQASLRSSTALSPLEIENYKKANDIILNWQKAHSIYNISVQSILENIATELGALF